jgi:hypothetical protein
MAGGPILPSSIYLGGGAGLIYPNFYIPATNTNAAGALEGVGVIASLTSDAPAIMQFNMPETIPTGTLKLRILAMANATAGVAKLTVSDASTSAGSNIGVTSLTAETQYSQTWATADILVEQKLTLTATAPTANQITTIKAVFNTTGWTLASTSVFQFSLVWE